MFIAFEGIENARDLGGLTRPDGRRIRKDVLFRTGHLEKATDGDIRRLEEYGVSHVIDFRDLREVRDHPDRPLSGAEHHHIPALGDLHDIFAKRPDDPTLTPAELHRDFITIYRVLALSPHSQTAYEEFFRVLLESEGKPVLWHCTQGKDRTGIAGILLLIALGFEEDAAIEEYLLTNVHANRKIDAFRASGREPEKLDFVKELELVFEENARCWLHCVQVEYGNVQNYLELVLGLGPKEIETLEKYYLE